MVVGAEQAHAPALQALEQAIQRALVAAAARPIDQPARPALEGLPDPECSGLFLTKCQTSSISTTAVPPRAGSGLGARAAPRRLGLGTVGVRVIPDPAQHALRRDPDALGHRIHRQAQAIQLDRVPLHLHRLAARRGARELPAAARALALPALPPAGMAGPDQHRPAASRAGFRALVHHSSTVHARQHLSNGASVTTVKPSNRDARNGNDLIPKVLVVIARRRY